MSAPAPEAPAEPKEMHWTEPFIGLVFSLLILTGVGVAVAVSYDSDSAETVDSHEAEDDDSHG